MAKIKYVEDHKDEKLKVGDFVSVPWSSLCVTNDDYDFAIITKNLMVVSLKSGKCWGPFDNMKNLKTVLNPVHIIKPFVIDPSGDEEDEIKDITCR